MITAKLPDSWPVGPHIPGQGDRLTVYCIDRGQLRPLVECASYAKTNTTHCVLRVDGSHCQLGRAKGYGYHKASAAMQDALDKLGVQLYGTAHLCGRTPEERAAEVKASKRQRAHIDGRGDAAMVAAAQAIARALVGPRRKIYAVGDNV